jgi:hypothetical protein
MYLDKQSVMESDGWHTESRQRRESAEYMAPVVTMSLRDTLEWLDSECRQKRVHPLRTDNQSHSDCNNTMSITKFLNIHEILVTSPTSEKAVFETQQMIDQIRLEPI